MIGPSHGHGPITIHALDMLPVRVHVDRVGLWQVVVQALQVVLMAHGWTQLVWRVTLVESIMERMVG